MASVKRQGESGATSVKPRGAVLTRVKQEGAPPSVKQGRGRQRASNKSRAALTSVKQGRGAPTRRWRTGAVQCYMDFREFRR
jgi:hypothetical protein